RSRSPSSRRRKSNRRRRRRGSTRFAARRSIPNRSDAGSRHLLDNWYHELAGNGSRMSAGGLLMRTQSVAPVAVAVVVATALAALVSAQAANPRIGKWKLKQDPPALNIMTYEPFANSGMRVTVESTNAQGRT